MPLLVILLRGIFVLLLLGCCYIILSRILLDSCHDLIYDLDLFDLFVQECIIRCLPGLSVLTFFQLLDASIASRISSMLCCQKSSLDFFFMFLHISTHSMVLFSIISLRFCIRHGRRSVGDEGTRPPPTFQLGGDHIGNVPPPLFCLKSRKYHVCSSSSNLHSFVRPRTRHMLVEIASGHVPHRSTPMDA